MDDFKLIKNKVKKLKVAGKYGASLSPIDFEVIDIYEAMQSAQEEIERLRQKWFLYFEFMKEKYGENFQWTCEHLRGIDEILRGNMP